MPGSSTDGPCFSEILAEISMLPLTRRALGQRQVMDLIASLQTLRL